MPGPLNSVGHSGVVCVLILWRNTDNPERCIITFVKENSVTLITMWYREGIDVWTRRNSRRLRSCQDSFYWITPFSETLSTLLEQVCQILVQRYKCCSVRNFEIRVCVLKRSLSFCVLLKRCLKILCEWLWTWNIRSSCFLDKSHMPYHADSFT